MQTMPIYFARFSYPEHPDMERELLQLRQLRELVERLPVAGCPLPPRHHVRQAQRAQVREADEPLQAATLQHRGVQVQLVEPRDRNMLADDLCEKRPITRVAEDTQRVHGAASGREDADNEITVQADISYLCLYCLRIIDRHREVESVLRAELG